jgi:transposase-like protein
MTAYYDYPKAHWKHLRTTNICESNFDVVRSRTNVCKRLRQPESATYLVWALLVRRKSNWRRFNGYGLLEQVHRALMSKPVALLKAA